MGPITFASVLAFGNLILSSANVIIGFALLVYVLTHNARSSVARAFCALTAFVTIVYLGDVATSELQSPGAADGWLRAQWVGIAFVPAAYFHFSDALLRTTGARSRLRRGVVAATYGIGFLSLIGAVFTDLVVDGVLQTESFYHLSAGPLFLLFAAYYVLVTVGGLLNIRRARMRCLTSTSRRRMSYLMLAFVAPSLGGFPFLLLPTMAERLSTTTISMLTLAGNLGIAFMTIVIGYIVAYQGVLLPDRVVKHNLLHYLLRGPLVAILVIVLMLITPRVESILGLPRDTVLIVLVVTGVVVLQSLVSVFKPTIDRLIYRRDREEITLIQALDQRLLTTTDLEQLLENTLIAVCELLRVSSGFVVTMQNSRLSLRVFCGQAERATEFLAHANLPLLLQRLNKSRSEDFVANRDLILADGHWLLPLRASGDHATLGILGLAALAGEPNFDAEALASLYGLVRRLERALEDMELQQQVFHILQSLESELDQIQAWRSRPTYADRGELQRLETNPIHSPGFVQAVRDALSQLWGGPKLSQSPLTRMRVVRERLLGQDQVPAKAVRAVLQEAIDRLRPAGERNMTATEWVLYNILDLRFVQGERIRDITQRLALSESDFYRKQRVAIEQVAQTLIQMEHASEERDGADQVSQKE